MPDAGLRVALLGATGAVGSELRDVLDQRRFPLSKLVPFASDESIGDEIDFQGQLLQADRVGSAGLRGCGLVICAAAPGVLAPLLGDLEAEGARIVDLSGAFELETEVPLWVPGLAAEPAAQGKGWVGIPRGPVAGLALALAPLAREASLERVSVVCLESAAGSGRDGVAELTDHVLEILNAMTGEPPESEVFPRSLAFDCLPQVGPLLESGDTGEERRLGHVVRRLLGIPTLEVEVTRVRVPIFSGSLALVHVAGSALDPERARSLWEKQERLHVLDPHELPTPRRALGHEEVRIGRVREAGQGGVGLAFALALDDVRFAARAAVEAAEALCR